MHGLRVTPLTTDLEDAFFGLFDACASGCYCEYWHFEGTKNDWLARLASSPEKNREDHRAHVAKCPRATGGLLAFHDGRAVGWVKLAPRSELPKLRRLPVYRSLDLGPDDGVVSIGCMLVDPAFRRHGVARALVAGAIRTATDLGARAVEAYPFARADPLTDEQLWMGPAPLLETLGFTHVAGEAPYPVLRLALTDRVSGR